MTSGLSDFLLGDFPIACTCARDHDERPSTWKTQEGIGTGEFGRGCRESLWTPSAEKKLDAQKPVLEIKGLLAGYRAGDSQPRLGDRVIIYGPRGLQAVDFGIRDGKVSYIWLKESDFWLRTASRRST